MQPSFHQLSQKKNILRIIPSLQYQNWSQDLATIHQALQALPKSPASTSFGLADFSAVFDLT
jgi:hypothetical protein